MNLHYLLLVNFYLVLFFGFYILLLRKETFFQLNRIYLIATCLLSFIIPATQLTWLQNLVITQNLQEKIITYTSPVITITGAVHTDNAYTLLQILYAVYITGCTIMLVKLIRQLLALKQIINHPSSSTAYTFFKKINIGKNLHDNRIIQDHEQVHARQWHSADVVLIELITIINWFNPVVYLYRNTIKHLHEFIADSDVIQSGINKTDYALLLFNETFNPTHNLTTSFYNHSLLKQRIIMIQKNRSQRTALLKYGLTAPLFVLMLVLSSATVSNYQQQGPPEPPKPRIGKTQENGVYVSTEVIPKFPGGIKAFGKFLSKNIKYPAADRENNIQGKVIVQYTVETNGSLSDIKAVRSPTDAMAKEAIRVISMSPKWMPGKQGGKAVRSRYVVPVSFVLQKES